MTKDLKYIIKRVIIGVLISIILMFISSFKVSAEVYSGSYFTTNNGVIILDSVSGSISNNIKPFANKSGKLTFSLYQAPTESGGEYISEIDVSDGTNTYVCNIGNLTFYNDNSTQRAISTVVCDVSFNSNGWSKIIFYRPGDKNLYIRLSTFANLSTNNENMSGNISTQFQDLITAINNQTTQDGYFYYDYRTQVIPKLNDIYNAIVNNNTSITTSIDNNTNAINNVNDSITSEESPSQNEVSNNTSDWSSNNATNGTITNLLTLPITLLNGYISGINSSCSSFNLGSLYGNNLILPCINISNYLGVTLWGVIDVLFSGFMIFAIGKKLVKIFNDFTNLRDNQIDELYGGGA